MSKDLDDQSTPILYYSSHDQMLKILPLERFCENHHNNKFMEMFESDNLDPSIENNVLSKRAIASNNVEILSYLLNKGANISNENMYKITFFYKIKINMIKFLFDYGIDFINNTDFIFSCVSSIYGEDIIEFLLAQGMNANKFLNANIDEKHLIDVAVKRRYLKAIKILISYGADPSLNTSRCLSLAIKTGEEEIIRLLLKNGAQQSSVTPEDLSTMFKSKPSSRLINFLVDQGFDFSMVNNVKFDKPYIDEICPMLIELGVDSFQLIKIFSSEKN